MRVLGARLVGGRSKGAAFTMLWETVRRAEGSSNLSAAELMTLHALMAFQEDPGGRLSRPATSIAEETSLSVATVRKALSGLTRKTFETPGGGRAPFLTRIAPGHRGSVAVYRLNVPRTWAAKGPDGRAA